MEKAQIAAEKGGLCVFVPVNRPKNPSCDHAAKQQPKKTSAFPGHALIDEPQCFCIVLNITAGSFLPTDSKICCCCCCCCCCCLV